LSHEPTTPDSHALSLHDALSDLSVLVTWAPAGLMQIRPAVNRSSIPSKLGAMYSSVTVRDHTLTVPWYEGETIEVFCRELSRDDTLPPLIFLQGGPGHPARPSSEGWLAEALTDHRVFLLDQRGTGRSTRIDRHGDPSLLDATHLAHLRASDIVADAEAFRE